MAKRNVSIESVEIGIEDVRKIEILPLSLAAERRIWNIVSEFQDYVAELTEEVGSIDDVPVNKLIEKGVQLVIDNMETVLQSVTKKGTDVAELLEEITNENAIDIAYCIYRNNIEKVKKKIQKMLTKTDQLKESMKK